MLVGPLSQVRQRFGDDLLRFQPKAPLQLQLCVYPNLQAGFEQ